MWVIFYLSYVRHYHFLLQIHLFLLHTVYELQLALPQERLVNSQLGSILVQTWDFIIPNFQSWVLFGAMLGIYFAEKLSSQFPMRFPNLNPNFLFLLTKIGDDLGWYWVVVSTMCLLWNHLITIWVKLGNHQNPNYTLWGEFGVMLFHL